MAAAKAAKKEQAKKGTAGKAGESGRDKVVLAYSGGLDTSVDIHWLSENYNVDVVAVSVDVGQPKAEDDIIARAKRNGAVDAMFIDVRKEFVENYVWPLVKANGLYQDVYPLSTAIARPLMAKTLVEVAEKVGAKYIAHGCTGKGNDQVRFDAGIVAQNPDLKILAPQREWVVSRDEEIDYAAEHGIEIKAKKNSPYSRDENLWGASCECGALEDAWSEPPAGVWAHTVDPDKAPDEPTYIEIGFEKGVPVSLNGKKTDGVTLIEKLDKIAGDNGVGRIDHVEDRLVGIKSRETYECPAAVVIIAAHKAMEAMCLQREVLDFKRIVEQKFTRIVYDGQWFGGLREPVNAFIDKTQEYVTGTVRVKLYKGSVTVVGRKSPVSLYDQGLATYSKDTVDTFDHKAAMGFIYVWGLPDQTAARAHAGAKGKSKKQ
ncbi:argininosuccinate synthase [Candidatus Methanomethylophilus sp. 1R26]|jgi:argininosuccinate synthase|uniref:argininosuccinate synthase n=1 Tax=Candidatus Methanomethylophilus sp. 1R26 TaxID=1769296 RepID=UPI000737917A|nr:argininosuccinate synthase [Candidatus Methanomethylophilus sp. 1R26]MCH3978131.1 argininosuccinate synthase [Methanomethylophilus sp.]TQS78810.1 MAG: argininosuccinate synthase [Methanomethylophilus alvi]WII09651.1 argininosuccinate synthase [Methanomassiliicoccales archaeon LGM-DZ1]KUE73371.1 argininosuccinate synthase [Candidatus Methanomethylophilus sp. 1R26]MCI2074383.1 argininosuccinate synthase [Methanomethylophilus sp.]